MAVIQDFVSRYRREFDFFNEAARLVAQQLESRLQATGIRSIVTYRAKRPDRLEEKLEKRSKKRDNGYGTVEEIYTDIVDLSGVRVALYFPGDRAIVGNIIESIFSLVEPAKSFPNFSEPPPSFTSDLGENYQKKFTGYWATHYRVYLNDASLDDSKKRYAEARVEIQVASVLMHAWSEVDHDLIYKPLQGPLSIDEYAILDEINGLVQSGEIALEQLQRAIEKRVARENSSFSNHYELAAYLFEKAKPLLLSQPNEPVMGRVDVLFDLLKQIGIGTPEGVAPYIKSLNPTSDKRPIADQIIDEIIAADPERYDMFASIRAQMQGKSFYNFDNHAREGTDQQVAIGYFLSQWIQFEKAFRIYGKQVGIDDRSLQMPNSNVFSKLGMFDAKTIAALDQIRRMRNEIVHGISMPEVQYITEAGDILKQIVTEIHVQQI